MIEAMACGTPVIAWRCGSVPEVVEDGVTGFIVDTLDEAVAAVHAVRRARPRARPRARSSGASRPQAMARRYSAALLAALRASTAPRSASARPRERPTTSPAAAARRTTRGRLPPARAAQRLFALKDGDTFVVADAFGDIVGEGDGLFHNDTRLLSRFRLLLGGAPPTLLSSAVSQDNVFFTANLTNRPLPPLGEPVHARGRDPRRARAASCGTTGSTSASRCANYSDRRRALPLRLEFAADFRDMFEVRGPSRATRGAVCGRRVDGARGRAALQGLDGAVRAACVIAFSEAPRRIDAQAAPTSTVTLRPAQRHELYRRGRARRAPSRRRAQRFRDAAAQARAQPCARGAAAAPGCAPPAGCSTSGSTSRAPTWRCSPPSCRPGPIPTPASPGSRPPSAATRSSPRCRCCGSIRRWRAACCASWRRTRRRRPRASTTPRPARSCTRRARARWPRCGELPFGQLLRRRRHHAAVRDAGRRLRASAPATWPDRRAWPALDGRDALDRGRRRRGPRRASSTTPAAQTTGLANQGWKDSDDSVFHADGRSPVGPIALVEVQGYAFAASRPWPCWRARAATPRRGRALAARARGCAEAVEERFWMEDMGFYALALDGEGEPCRVRASNAGHLLFSGLPSRRARARAWPSSCSRRAFNSGWGIRTLAVGEPRYNPMSLPQRLGLAARHRAVRGGPGALRRARRRGAAAERHVRGRGSVRHAAARAVLRLPARAPASRRSPTPWPACRRPGRRARCS